jgi:hypothetical protein
MTLTEMKQRAIEAKRLWDEFIEAGDAVGLADHVPDLADMVLALCEVIERKDHHLKEAEFGLLIRAHPQHLRAYEEIKKALALQPEIKNVENAPSDPIKSVKNPPSDPVKSVVKE